MQTQTYPQASLLKTRCPNCENGKAESGGYRIRKHRDVGGVREVKVLRVRCRVCKKSLGCVYPAGVQRYKWYSSKLQGVFAILAVHQVSEACAHEIANHLGYAVVAETRASWQATRAFRATQLEARTNVNKQLEVASLDEFKVGQWWVYTLTDTDSQAIVDYTVCESRDEEVVRQLIAHNDPQALVSDGCTSIAAAASYFADKPHGRCWFHVIRDVLSKFPKEDRKLVALDLRYLYQQTNDQDGEWFLGILKQRYDPDKLQALSLAWKQLKHYWQVPAMPLTNNCSEHLYSALWSRTRKRVVKAFDRVVDWFIEARWRWHHHLIKGVSPWQRFTRQPSPNWLNPLITPLNHSTNF